MKPKNTKNTMTLNQDRIDVALTAEQVTAINTALEALSDAMPFLQSLTTQERKSMSKLGPKSHAFATQALQVGKLHPGILPAELQLNKIERDAAFFATLSTIRIALEQLTTKVNDTLTLAGVDWMNGALTIYHSIRVHGETAGLDVMVQELKQRFAKRPKATPPDTGTDSPTNPPASA